MSIKVHYPMRSAIQHTPTIARYMAGMALVASLTACGYKGDLYMPPPPPQPDATLTVPPAPQQPLTESAN